mmetsp:Transcript_54416/g.82429  ORF Transcript_54416/g.82429 Transcript_54416/m.82429 type:complete len:96 (+) Transcript_54416:136-423(+)
MFSSNFLRYKEALQKTIQYSTHFQYIHTNNQNKKSQVTDQNDFVSIVVLVIHHNGGEAQMDENRYATLAVSIFTGMCKEKSLFNMLLHLIQYLQY